MTTTNTRELLRLWEEEQATREAFTAALNSGAAPEEARAKTDAYTRAYRACTDFALTQVEPYSDYGSVRDDVHEPKGPQHIEPQPDEPPRPTPDG